MLNFSSSLVHVLGCEKDESACPQCQAIKAARDPDLYEVWEGFEDIQATRYVSDPVKKILDDLTLGG